MANLTKFFHWYKRYKVRAQDMNDFQDAMVEVARGLGEGGFGSVVLDGMEVAPVSGMLVAVSGGITTGPSGYLGVSDGVFLDCSAASGTSMPRRSIIVARPNLVDTDLINSPTAPFTQVPLRQEQDISIVLIEGTPAQSPEYPAKLANDVVLAGIRMPASGVTLSTDVIDFEARECVGASSLIHKNQVHYDDRLMPTRGSATVMRVKPSQTVGSGPIGLSYPGRSIPSIFPKSAGAFNPADTLIDFGTGAITGGDETTSDFTPTIPTAENSIICEVSLLEDDTLSFRYGTQGTRAQCLTAIRNQTRDGSAGSLSSAGFSFPIAYAVVNSHGGAISDIDVIDARPFFGAGGAAAQLKQSIANNQSSAADVTVFPAWKRTQVVELRFMYQAMRSSATGSLMQSGAVYLGYNSASSGWQVTKNPVHDLADDQPIDVVDFSVASTANPDEYKLQYRTSNLGGSGYAGTLRITDIQRIMA